jgi:hypothetical protein
MVAKRGELQGVVDVARQRIHGLQVDIGAGHDTSGRKVRELQRLQLYTSVVKRISRGGALMPELVDANRRGHFHI